MLKQRKAKNIRQKLSHDSDTEEYDRKEEYSKQQPNEIYVKRTKPTSAFGRKWSNKKTGVVLGQETKPNKELHSTTCIVDENKQEWEDEWFPKDFKQLANSSSLMNPTELEVVQPKPEYSLETMEELKKQTFGWNKELTEKSNALSQLEQPSKEPINSSKETFQESFLRIEDDEEMEAYTEEDVDSESEALWELDQLKRASGNNKYTKRLEKLSNKKLESFHKPEILQDPLIVLEKVRKSLEDAMKTSDEEMSKVLLEEKETEKALDNCQRQLKEKESQAMEASEKYSFYEDLGQYFDDLLDMLNEKWKQLDSLRNREEQIYHEYQVNEKFRGISLLEESDWILVPKGEEELEQERDVLSYPSLSDGSESSIMACKDRIVNELAHITASRNALFEDVEWDYASILQVVAHFVWWRRNYPKDYEEAYGELMLSKLVTEYTKIELLGCWPFGLQSLWDIQSIQALEFYHQEFGETLSHSSCLSFVLEDAIIPILAKWIRYLYSFQDRNETRKMSVFYKEVRELSKDSECLALIQEKMNEIFLEKAKDILFQFTELSQSWNNEQQWNAYVYILRMISYWHAFIPFEKTVEQFLLNEIITRHMLPKVRDLPSEDILNHLYFILCHCLPQEWPDPCSQYWLAIRALLTRLVSTIKDTDKQEALEACKRRCGYY
ncbi:hypothetical protein GpartN1_g6318.t1 [Galdieria partita]|uniref:GCF C-terminal domain-containing protein n=1 Tax=Galdieria partita TaxID=83374 RepID=A0A9C7UTB8_9RHOD|nr:hypothetical protein GpartN1_g6318.t1 [Galdieria partita]